jgi:hypothetical protein
MKTGAATERLTRSMYAIICDETSRIKIDHGTERLTRGIADMGISFVER